MLCHYANMIPALTVNGNSCLTGKKQQQAFVEDFGLQTLAHFYLRLIFLCMVA